MLPKKQTLFKYIDDEKSQINRENTGREIDLCFNFDTGEFVVNDGKVATVDKIDRVKQWIEKAIKTDAYVSRLYTYSHYGLYTDKIVGHVYDKDYIDALMKLEIDYVMRLCKEIKGTRDITIISEGDLLTVTYTVILEDGTEFENRNEVVMHV